MMGCRIDWMGRAWRWPVAVLVLGGVLAGSLSGVAAQEAPNPLPRAANGAEATQNPQVPAPMPRKPDPAQQQGVQVQKGAQVQTGSQVGEGAIQNLANRLTALLGDHQFLEMEALLDQAEDAGPDAAAAKARLTPEQRQLFRGVLANRENKPQESIQQLVPLLDQISARAAAGGDATASAGEEKLVRKTLAEDYLRVGDWAKAAKAYEDLNSRSAASLTLDEKEEIELPLKLLPLAANHPPMTVEPGAAFRLPFDRDALGLTDVPVFVDAQSHDWMLDPTAPFNLICRSTAKAVGLKISEESAVVHTITGKPMQVRTTVIPRFTLGTVTYRNMTAFVFEDADYFFPKSAYQVRGVLGYPAISALGSITISADARIDVQPGEKGERLTTGARFFLDGDRVIAELGSAGHPEDERAYVIDASGQQSYLSSRYYAEHADEFADKKMQLMPMPGGEGRAPSPAYVDESVTLEVGNTPVTFSYVQVLTEPMGNSAIEDTYGTLGVDALEELKSYTFDYRTMRFAVKSE